ncbi:hypothetical protein BH24ACT26_BH24ACT26_17660 [soil metagenome]
MGTRRSVVCFVVLSVVLGLSSAGGAVPRRKDPLRSKKVVELRLHGADVAGRALHRASASAAPSATSGSRSARPATENFRVLGHTKLSGGPPWADVFFYDYGGETGKYAFVGTWRGNCASRGVQIVDVNDPARPAVVAVTGGKKRVSREDVVVRRIGGRDILAIGIQSCSFGAKQPLLGFKLVDVSDPSGPTDLSFFKLEEGAHGVHELDVVVRDDGQALALLAVSGAEFPLTVGAEGKGEFRIVDISDPEDPAELADWGIIADSDLEIFSGNDPVASSFNGLGPFPAHFAHSARAADDGMTAYVSYWDGGVLKFDISDPADPQLIGRTMYPPGADGDGHSMTPYDVGGKRYILQNDEDIDTLPAVLVGSSATGDARYQGAQQPYARTPLVKSSGLVSGNVKDAGDGCEARDYRDSKGKIVLVDVVDPFYVGVFEGWPKPPCRVAFQMLSAVRAGAKAVVLNLISQDDPFAFYPRVLRKYQELLEQEAKDVPIVEIASIDELAGDIRAGLQAGAVKITLRAQTPSVGFLRVFDEDAASDVNGDGTPEYEQVGSFFDLPHVKGQYRMPAPYNWTIHNTEVSGDRAYSSWYAHGIVALDLTDPTSPELVGQFVPPLSVVWGVAIDPETGLIYASDIDSGLWIIEPTGAAAPTS